MPSPLLPSTTAFLAIAFAIRLESRGPVFFKQKRYGFNNELIEVCKLSLEAAIRKMTALVAERFGLGPVDGKIQAHVVTIER